MLLLHFIVEMTDSCLGSSSCRSSIQSFDFECSDSSVASCVSTRNAAIPSSSSIHALLTDQEIYSTATSVIPNLRSVLDYRNELCRRSSVWRRVPVINPPPPCWVLLKKLHGIDISEFDRAKVQPVSKSMDTCKWFRKSFRIADARQSMIESRDALFTCDDAVERERTQSDTPVNNPPQWPLNDLDVTYAVMAHVTLNCRLDEAMTMLFNHNALHFDASMRALFGSKKYKSGELLFSHNTCQSDINDPSPPSLCALQSIVLRSRRSRLHPLTAATQPSRRQRLCFAAYSHYSPNANEAMYTMKTLRQPLHDHLVGPQHASKSRHTEQIAAGYHLMSSYSDLSGHQTQIVMTAYVLNSAPFTTATPRSKARPHDAFHRSRVAPGTATPEAKYVVHLLATATSSFEPLVRRRRLGIQSLLHTPMICNNTVENQCNVCLKPFNVLRSPRFCQLCAQRVCRDCCRKFEVESVAPTVRRHRLCYTCVASVDASVFQPDPSFFRPSFASLSTQSFQSNDRVASSRSTQATVEENNVFVPSQTHSCAVACPKNEETMPLKEYDSSWHRQDRSSSVATTSTSFSSTSGRQLADALFSSHGPTRARALAIVRQVVQHVTSDTTPSNLCVNTSMRCSEGPENDIVDKYLEARWHLSRIATTSYTNHKDVRIPTNRTRSYSSSPLEHGMMPRRRCNTSGHQRDNLNENTTNIRLDSIRTKLETELDLDDEMYSAALNAICQVAAHRMQCAMAYIVAFHQVPCSQAPRVVGVFGMSRSRTDAVIACPLSFLANGKPFVVLNVQQELQLRHVYDRGVRFVAGFPILAPNGKIVACLCTMDTGVHGTISTEDHTAMHALSKLASDLFEEEVNPYTPRH